MLTADMLIAGGTHALFLLTQYVWKVVAQSQVQISTVQVYFKQHQGQSMPLDGDLVR